MFVGSNNETHTTMNTNHNTNQTQTAIFKLDKGLYEVYHSAKNTNVGLHYVIKHEPNGWTIYNNGQVMACVQMKDEAIRCIQMATPSNLSR